MELALGPEEGIFDGGKRINVRDVRLERFVPLKLTLHA